MSIDSLMKFALAAALAAGSTLAAAQAPDNTARNRRDSITAGDQGNTDADRQLARKIRKDIVAEKEFSTYAKNVKVIVRDGTVVLKGPVRSDIEKSRIAEIAAKHAGEAKVTNQIEIAPDDK